MKLVVEDPHILRSVCGIEDSHIAFIEEITGTVIYTEGNILSAEPVSDISKVDLAIGVLKRLIEVVRQGVDIDIHAIQMAFDQLSGSPSDPLGPVPSIWLSGKRVVGKSTRQNEYLRAMESHQVVFGIGPAGTGKTYLAIAKALEVLQSGEVNKIVLTRPVVEAGESLGFLPGDLTQKISPYLRPLYDAMESLVSMHTVKKMEEQGVIEIAPLAYMRGRSLQNAYIILDEAQNTTKEQMKMFLTRIGFGSKAVITGDVTQVDLPKKSTSGLLHACTLLASVKGIRIIELDSRDVIRSPLVRRIVEAYEKEY